MVSDEIGKRGRNKGRKALEEIHRLEGQGGDASLGSRRFIYSYFLKTTSRLRISSVFINLDQVCD